MGRTWMLAVAMGLLGGVTAAQAQSWERSDEGWCEREWRGGDQERRCVVLTAEVADAGRLEVDGGMNGGVTVEGWGGDRVRVSARVWAQARSESRAQELVEEIRLRADDGRLSADGPDTDRREGWGVNWVVSVPHETDLDIDTHNGGISVTDVRGRMRFEAMNGGVHLERLAGDVEGRTTNGGLRIELEGERWQGEGLDVETFNGGVSVYVPEGYSAQFVTSTVNGGIDLDFPVTVRGRLGRRLDVALGDGGPMVRAVTTNGGVRVARAGRASMR